MVWVIELNDAQTRVSDANGVIASTPAYAVLDHRSLKIGHEAYAAARANPKAVVNQFWQRLSQDALPTMAPRARTYADLAYAHLNELIAAAAQQPVSHEAKQSHDAKQVMFAAPAAFTNTQLGLLLGIAKQANLTVTGFVDTAVATASELAAVTPSVHVDVHLHQILLTRVEPQHGMLTRVAFETLDDGGLVALQSQWMQLLADLFVNETRFDPLHQAHTEQALYDAIESWLSLLRLQPDVIVECEHRGKLHRVKPTREQFQRVSHGRYAQIAKLAATLAGQDAQFIMSDTASLLPGLAELLQTINPALPTLRAQPHHAGKGALHHREFIERDEAALTFVSALPLAASAPEQKPAKLAERVPAFSGTATMSDGNDATHLLWRDRVYPINDRALAVGYGRVNESRYLQLADGPPEVVFSLLRSAQRTLLITASPRAVRVNGQPAQGAHVLNVSDRIDIDGVEDNLRVVGWVSHAP